MEIFVNLTHGGQANKKMSRQTFYLNARHIVSIHDNGTGAMVFDVISGDEPYYTVETADEILRQLPGRAY